MSETGNRATDIGQIAFDIGIDLNTTISLLKMLFPKTRETNARLRQAAENGDYEDVVMFAHDIKGSCGNFRLMDIYKTSAGVEKMGKNNDDIKKILKQSSQIDDMLDWYIEEVGKYNGSIEGSSD